MSDEKTHGFQTGPFRSVEEISKELKALDRRNQPRMQNIPLRTETGDRIRAAFRDNHGVPIESLNYNQLELRVMASLIATFKKDYPELANGMTEDEIVDELVRQPVRSVQSFTKVAKDSKSSGRRPSFNTKGVVSGRWSSKEVNLSNDPKSGREKK